MRHTGTLAAMLLVCLVALAPHAAAETRPVGFDDIMALKAVGSAAISPDGAWVLYTVRAWEDATEKDGKKESRSHVWRVATATPFAARQFTFGERGETSPAWSPDGRLISFLSARDAGERGEEPKPQIWLMRADGGEAWKLTGVGEGVIAYRWSPDSRRIAFVSREPLPGAATDRQKRKDDARVFEGDFRLSRLWTVDVTTGEAEELTAGASFTVRGEPSWSPDSSRVAFTGAPTPMIRDTRDDVYIVTVDGKAVDKITMDPGPDTSPAWSPDGKTIAYLSEPSAARPKGDGIAFQPLVHARLMLHDVAARSATDASSLQFDISPSSVTWAPDGRRILLNAGSRVYREVFAYEPATGTYAQLTRGLNVTGGSLTRDGSRVAFTRDTPSWPAEVYMADGSFRDAQRLTTTNPQLASVALGQTEVITWKSGDGREIEGVLLKPVGYEAGKRYPLLLVVHGGPTGAHVNGFRMSAGDAGQHWAGEGWAVLYPNPRGSSNYGEAFMRANIPDWGGGDYRDVMAGVDAVIQRGVADPGKLAVMGWSYGGYMTCWIVSQTSRFKAAMMGAGISNLVSMYGTNDIPDYLGTFFRGMPAKETMPLYVERSGLSFVDGVATPLLILHGGSDERVPIGQPMEFYRALKDRAKTVELVFYPREGHGISEYYHQLDRLKRQHEWIARYTVGGARKTTNP